MIRASVRVAPEVRGLGLLFATGDVLAARALAEALLEPVGKDRRDARLLLMALLLHLDAANGPEPQISDVEHILLATAQSVAALDVLAASPMAFLRYAFAELLSLDADALASAIEICLQSAAKLGPRVG